MFRPTREERVGAQRAQSGRYQGLHTLRQPIGHVVPRSTGSAAPSGHLFVGRRHGQGEARAHRHPATGAGLAGGREQLAQARAAPQVVSRNVHEVGERGALRHLPAALPLERARMTDPKTTLPAQPANLRGGHEHARGAPAHRRHALHPLNTALHGRPLADHLGGARTDGRVIRRSGRFRERIPRRGGAWTEAEARKRSRRPLARVQRNGRPR
mmetsp:Transcript_17536/g.52997  ORF Transcript_17536/g.52997 Transcript_17536/m.52997 type:complete len:213 (+) Transcript_17536:998-1636(+)